jgi:hypothetical protein
MVKLIDGYTDYYITSNGNVISRKYNKTRILKKNIRSNNYQYYYVNLSDDGVLKNHSIHRLVATHHVPNPDNYSYVKHINGNTLDNRAENLLWTKKSYPKSYKCTKINSSGIKHIYKSGKKFRIQIPRLNIHKSFNTLDEAIEFKKHIIF